jgi:hypothetical protein
MPRDFIHIVTSDPAPDAEGMELPSLWAARAEAMTSARELARPDGLEDCCGEDCLIQIADADGNIRDTVVVPAETRNLAAPPGFPFVTLS